MMNVLDCGKVNQLLVLDDDLFVCGGGGEIAPAFKSLSCPPLHKCTVYSYSYYCFDCPASCQLVLPACPASLSRLPVLLGCLACLSSKPEKPDIDTHACSSLPIQDGLSCLPVVIVCPESR
jgi:hypothetical protein